MRVVDKRNSPSPKKERTVAQGYLQRLSEKFLVLILCIWLLFHPFFTVVTVCGEIISPAWTS